jgi:glutaredoxin
MITTNTPKHSIAHRLKRFGQWLFLCLLGMIFSWTLNGCQSHPKTPPHIVIYTKVGCPRCARSIEVLHQKQLKFEEKSVAQREWATEMWRELKKNGHQQGQSITMPVVLIDSTLYYNLDDIDHFFRGLH